jgi:two-component system, cell cycle sensor histidine kinase and response regulator CckA
MGSSSSSSPSLVIIPCLVLFYTFYQDLVFLNTHQLALIAFIFLMVLGGLHILRQMFERIIFLASSVKNVGAEDTGYADVQREKDELKDLSNSLHRVLNRLEKTTRDLRRRSFDLLTIRESMEAARNSLDIYHIMDMILGKAMGLTEARIGSILIAESATEQFRVAASKGLDDVLKKGMSIPMQSSLARQVLLRKKPLLVTDIRQDHRTERPNQARYKSPSFLSMPILIGNEVSAVLNLADKENGLTFNHEDEELSSILLREISFALENAQLHGRIKDQLEEIREKNLQLEKEVTERRRVEDELEKYQGNLQQLVEEQTAELNRTNLQLQQEVRDRSAAEEALRESEKRYREFVDLLPQMVFETDSQWKLTFFNRAVSTHAGYGEEDIRRGLTFLEMVVPEERERVAVNFKRRLQNEFVAGVEYNLLRKDGTIFPVMIYAGPLLANDEARGLQGVIFDLYDRKRLEQQLIQAQKLEAAGTLAGGIAHDFNNLLMGIQGYASLMLLDMEPSHPHYDRLQRIEDYVKSGAYLTTQLLGFAQGGRGEVSPTQMNDILEKSSTLFGRTKKEITMHTKLAADLWTVEVDRGQMEQVFMNLYMNAWQAMPSGGEIFLESSNTVLQNDDVHPYEIKPGKYVKITVTDTGVGMDIKTKERIFEPFFTTKTMEVGTGLGLAMVYGIMKGHGGMIHVYSEPGHGTTFSIYLPASAMNAVADNEEAFQIIRGTETILLVEDERAVLEVSTETLASLGYKVFAAGSGQDAIALYLEHRESIQLVVLDLIMPGMSGDETFARLKRMNPEIKVLLSSGYGMNQNVQHLMDLGCRGFIQKPFNIGDLSKKLREVLDT